MEPAKALLRLEELCARAEHCEFELRQKLYRWMVPASDADTIINSLKHRRFLDDQRFTRAFVRDKIQYARWGKRKIALALAAKRIERDTVAEALDDIDQSDYENNLAELLKAKARTIDDAKTYDGRTKLFRFAASRGFEPDLVAKYIRKLFI